MVLYEYRSKSDRRSALSEEKRKAVTRAGLSPRPLFSTPDAQYICDIGNFASIRVCERVCQSKETASSEHNAGNFFFILCERKKRVKRAVFDREDKNFRYKV